MTHLNGARPASAIGGDAVGVELGGGGGTCDGESRAGGGASGDAVRGVGVMDGHSPSIRTIRSRGSIAQCVDTRDDAAKLVIAGARDREADLRGKVGLPCRNLTTQGVVAIAGREPCDIGHVERDKARRGDHAPFDVVVPGGGRAIGLGFRDLMTAVPRRGRNLPGEVFGCNPLALWIVRHRVSGDSVPNAVDVRICFLFENFTAVVGGRYVAGGLAGHGRGRLFVKMGDGTDPIVGRKFIVICVKSSIPMANGLDKTGAAVERDARPYQASVPRSLFPIPLFHGIECSDRSKRIRTAEGSTLGADALDDICEWRVDIVGAFAFDAV